MFISPKFCILGAFENMCRVGPCYFNILSSMSADYGGIYLDNDVIAVKSFDNMRVYKLAMSIESSGAIASGIIVSIILLLADSIQLL